MPTGGASFMMIAPAPIKPAIPTNIDNVLGTASKAKLAQFLTDLASAKGLGDLAKKHGITKSKRQEDHLRNDWLNETGAGWWQAQQPIEPILREGFRRLSLLVKSLSLPVSTYWIPYGVATPVAVVLQIGAGEIEMDIYTPEAPPPPHPRRVPMKIARNVLVIARSRRGRVRAIHPRFPR